MAHSHEPATASPEAVEHANAVWQSFCTLSKWGILHIIAILALMAFFFIGLR